MSGSIKLTDFKNQIQDVARPNRFWLSFRGTGANLWSDENMSFAVETASLPGRTIGTLDLHWQGMVAKLAGDPTFEDISLSILNSYEWNVRNFFEMWLETIATQSTNARTAHTDYKSEMIITQLGRTDAEQLAVYVLTGAYPTSIDAVQLGMDQNDTAEKFNVNIRYDQFYREDSLGAGISPKP